MKENLIKKFREFTSKKYNKPEEDVGMTINTYIKFMEKYKMEVALHEQALETLVLSIGNVYKSMRDEDDVRTMVSFYETCITSSMTKLLGLIPEESRNHIIDVVKKFNDDKESRDFVQELKDEDKNDRK